MTAFSRIESSTEHGDFVWEIRSVNHRYLDSSVRLDERFKALEMNIKKGFSDRLARGKVEASLRFKPTDLEKSDLNIDQVLAKSVIEQCDTLAQFTDRSAPINMLDVLQWPGVLQAKELDQQTLNTELMKALELAIDELVMVRETEGLALQNMIEQRCDAINVIIADVAQRMPVIMEQQRIRLNDRVTEMNVNLDAERLEQEMVLLAQKSDVAEELDRLQSHVREVQNVLQRDEPTGRRLDFLMQELNREANTLGSKSINTETTRHSVELKVLIEQMREQIQNIE